MADSEGAHPAEGDWIAEDANPLGGYLWIRRGKGEEQGSPLPSSLVQQMRRLQEQAAPSSGRKRNVWDREDLQYTINETWIQASCFSNTVMKILMPIHHHDLERWNWVQIEEHKKLPGWSIFYVMYLLYRLEI